MTPVPPPTDLTGEARDTWTEKAARYAARGQIVRGKGLEMLRRYVELEVRMFKQFADENDCPEVADIEEHLQLARFFLDTPRAWAEAMGGDQQ